MYNSILLRYGEIFLKGKNKREFTVKLADNIKKMINEKVEILHNRLLTDYFVSHGVLKRVFGLISYSPCVRLGENWNVSVEEIKEAAVLLLGREKGTFRVETKRSDKRFLIKSPELNRILGMEIEEKLGLEFNFKCAEVVLGIEINEKGVFLYKEVVGCFGGLPVGTSGKVALLVEGEQSVLAGLLMMKRGCELELVGFEKTELCFEEKDINLLDLFSPKTLSLKRVFDYKEIDSMNVEALVVGDVFGDDISRATKMVEYKPLINYMDKNVKQELKRFKNES